jgi:hypothetical protein
MLSPQLRPRMFTLPPCCQGILAWSGSAVFGPSQAVADEQGRQAVAWIGSMARRVSCAPERINSAAPRDHRRRMVGRALG